MQSKKLRMPVGISQVPDDNQGIYAFYLRLPSNYEFGVGVRAEDKVRQTIIGFLDRWQQLSFPLELTGRLRDIKSQHLRNTFIVESKPYKRNNRLISKVVERLQTQHEIAHFLDLMRDLLEDGNPLYIGMTHKQSLQVRVSQHLSCETKFSNKLFELGFRWENVYLKYTTVNLNDSKHLRELEMLTQSLIRPKLSYR